MTSTETMQLWDHAAPLLTCPVCFARLRRDDRRLCCPAGHSFDLAKQGQVNLLLKAAPQHADTPQMVAARDRFLSAGHYAPITAALAAAVPDSSAVVVEVGAGTAHHLATMIEGVSAAVGIATDISSAAARRAARSHPRVVSVVADTWQRLPIADAAADVVACVFAPRQASEFRRVLRPGGRLLVLTPLPDHLASLRDRLGLLDIHPDKADQLDRQLADFTETDRRQLRFEITLEATAAADLVAMGPNAFHQHTRESPQHPTEGQPKVTTQVAVELRVVRR